MEFPSPINLQEARNLQQSQNYEQPQTIIQGVRRGLRPRPVKPPDRYMPTGGKSRKKSRRTRKSKRNKKNRKSRKNKK